MFERFLGAHSMKNKRLRKRRSVNPIPMLKSRMLPDGSVKRAEYRVGVDLRRLAKGQKCYLRLCGYQHDPRTVVLAHIRIGGIAGMGQKPPDICAVPLCVDCHACVDGRQTHYEEAGRTLPAGVMSELLRAQNQWLAWLWNNGYLHA